MTKFYVQSGQIREMVEAELWHEAAEEALKRVAKNNVIFGFAGLINVSKIGFIPEDEDEMTLKQHQDHGIHDIQFDTVKVMEGLDFKAEWEIIDV